MISRMKRMLGAVTSCLSLHDQSPQQLKGGYSEYAAGFCSFVAGRAASPVKSYMDLVKSTLSFPAPKRGGTLRDSRSEPNRFPRI